MGNKNLVLTSVLVLVLFSLFPIVSADVVVDKINPIASLFSSLGLASFDTNGRIGSDYSFVGSNEVRLNIGDRECLFASSDEELDFQIVDLTVSTSGNNILSGVIRSDKSECFTVTKQPVIVRWDVYARSDSAHRTTVYRMASDGLTWVFFDLVSPSSPYYCDSPSDVYYFKNVFTGRDVPTGCFSSEPDLSSLKDETWCMSEQNGRVSTNECGDSIWEGSEIAVLDNGRRCCVKRTPSGDDPASAWEVFRESDSSLNNFLGGIGDSLAVVWFWFLIFLGILAVIIILRVAGVL